MSAPSPNGRVALFGGTFDPPHYGHLLAAEQAAERLGLERVLFLPAGSPPHKVGEPVSPLADRLRMVDLAIADNPRFELSLADSQRPGPSFTADLLASVRAEIGPGPELFFLVGLDSLHDLPGWRDPRRVLEQCTLVVVSRPGQPPAELSALSDALPGAAEKILILDTPGVDISSTCLRASAAAGRSLRYLVPESVRAFIEANALYARERGG